jgi:hypothetical protein
MRTAYDTPRPPASDSATGRVGLSPSVMAGIRAALVARGSSLRQWAHTWARARGADQGSAYHTLRMAIQRRMNRRQPPLGPLALRLVRDLRAELGGTVVPDFGEAAGRPVASPHTGGGRPAAADLPHSED